MRAETSREEFLRTVRTRLGAHPALPAVPRPELTPSPTATVGDLAAQFTTALERIGGHVHRAANANDARGQIENILRAARVSRVVWVDAPNLRELALSSLSGDWQNERVANDGHSLRERVQSTDAAITGADYAITETGTLVLITRPEQPRLLSALPAIHIAVVSVAQLVPTLADLTPTLRRAAFDTSNITFVTGPSRTGDIEQTITIGAHGPREVHVVLMYD